jgi:hypothetical protein
MAVPLTAKHRRVQSSNRRRRRIGSTGRMYESSISLPVGVCVVVTLSPCWGLPSFRFLPTACAVGWILTPLRGCDQPSRYIRTPLTAISGPVSLFLMPPRLNTDSLRDGASPVSTDNKRRRDRHSHYCPRSRDGVPVSPEYLPVTEVYPPGKWFPPGALSRADAPGTPHPARS